MTVGKYWYLASQQQIVTLISLSLFPSWRTLACRSAALKMDESTRGPLVVRVLSTEKEARHIDVAALQTGLGTHYFIHFMEG